MTICCFPSQNYKKNLGKDTSCQMGHSVINADNQAKIIVNYSKRFGFVQSRECFRPAKASPSSSQGDAFVQT